MAFSTQHAQQYQQAVSAYMQEHYEDAASLSSALVSQYPDDPNLQLLCGHIYSCLRQYDMAQRHYQQVLRVTNDAELLAYAHNSLSDVAQILGDNSLEDTTGPAEFWPDASSYEEEDATQIQMGVAASKRQIEALAPDFKLAAHSAINASSVSEPQAGWQSLLFQEENFEEGLSEDADSDRASEIFDDDEEITLLMGKKGSQKPEGSMSDDQFSGEQANSNAAPNAANPVDGDSNLFDGSSSHEAALPSRSQEYGEAFGNFLNHIDRGEMNDRETLDNLDMSAPLHAESDPHLGVDFEDESYQNDGTFSGPEWDDSATQMTAVQPEEQLVGAMPARAAELSPNSAGDASLKGNSDKAAALNMVSRRLPVLAPFENAPLNKKPAIMAASTGIVAGVTALVVGSLPGGNPMTKIGLGALAAGITGGITTLALSQTVTRQFKASTSDLQAKLSAVAQGDWGVKAIEFSDDEFGQLAKSFNKMTHFIEASTRDSKRKADDQEKAKEDLQRQVIRLLDDVEGAARGDLTVQAEVTADILGAVADSFNLTIYNLQKIVKQVKVAAQEVNKGAAENEEFARGLSSDALRQAEELAATLNSVQMMTTSIQEVADSARSADQVAQRASEAALRGGESVESTVAGIMQIRETVAETTRKVKRLAESSQEISKIVGLISQIASRTNLLALNASIEAARAGESGRGFAVVADEVRQLADRAAKSSKEIEQIVLQIQGETSSVMTAMEEGTQQVIEGTQRAEQAKDSLKDIIQVSEQIKQLVGSITKATSEQTETSRYVGQVMQSVELTAQETSQEAQRVSDSLRNLVGVARDLQSSVERFKVEGTEFS
ncbi:methyl-accepting chemotaxis protein [Altericista sp. CCNU0014]|uniref:methyl-accepting chemotaxis protein n=1 Tax=Altericista sp. CCNU0014 TaxID=3082949 RepID=UPI0038512DC4